MTFPSENSGQMSIPRSAEQDVNWQRLLESFVIFNSWSEVVCELTMIRTVECGEEFRIVRLPSTKPVSRLEQESIPFFL